MPVEAPVTALIRRLLVQHALVGDLSDLRLEPLGGGVSSDILLVETGQRTLVVKRPLAALRVAEDWRAPLERSRSEAAWLEVAGSLVPGLCPEVLVYDDNHNFLALEYLDPADHRLWKADLMAGRVDPDVARAVGDRLGRVHALTSMRPELAERFATDELFTALRIEPYLLRLVDHHPQVTSAVHDLVISLRRTKHALVHGDVSPKNILVGPDGPVLLDAETAWWGDPAFDVAFCLNHLLLKCLLPGSPTDRLLDAVDALVQAYVAHVGWEPAVALLQRVGGLLPALMLARVDGRSPVEYLDRSSRDHVRAFALPLVSEHVEVATLTALWKDSLS